MIRRAALAAVLLAAPAAVADEFSYRPPGELVSGSGMGRADDNVYAPGMRFPIEEAPAFANSQVWGRGGSAGGGGSQCDTQNFSYPWHDNYCESRTWDMPLCPAGQGHQGQDIRAASCVKSVHWAVAADDGTITGIGSYSVYLTRADGTRFDYLHMSDVAVTVGQHVTRGQHMGKVANVFDGTATTVHLHFNIRQNVAGVGMVYVPPYLSLVESYRQLIGAPATADAGLTADAPPPRADAAPATKPDGGGPSMLDGGDVAGGCSLGGRTPRPSLALLLGVLLCLRRHGRTQAPARRQQG